MIDTRCLLTFREVVRAGNFSAAARSLGYTQPAISQQMQVLERSLGVPLFIRAGRTLLLTEAGKALERHCQQILDSIAVAEQHVASVAGLDSGSVRLCSFPSASAVLVPNAIAQLTAAYPRFRLELLEAEPPESLHALRRGECDVVVAFAYGNESEEVEQNLFKVPLMRDSLVVLLPRDSEFASRTSIMLDELREARWIAGCPRCRQQFVEACDAAGFEPDVVCATDDNLSVQSLVAVGMGFACVPELVVSSLQRPDLVAIPVDSAISRHVAAYTWPDLARAPGVAATLAALRESAHHPTLANPTREGQSAARAAARA
jgi:DNA-binding transcriptional LysR family regulator